MIFLLSIVALGKPSNLKKELMLRVFVFKGMFISLSYNGISIRLFCSGMFRLPCRVNIYFPIGTKPYFSSIKLR